MSSWKFLKPPLPHSICQSESGQEIVVLVSAITLLASSERPWMIGDQCVPWSVGVDGSRAEYIFKIDDTQISLLKGQAEKQ